MEDIRVINELVKRESAFVEDVMREISRAVVGQREMVHRILVAILTGGHILLEGVPGLAKTLTVNTVAESLKMQFSRIQFTPDLLPADIVGTMIYRPQTTEFVARKGPIFANLVLADEINRAPAKVQSALLEAMQEKQVTIGDQTYKLPKPFFVMATQNPIEQEGTYPLPEAQLDRFMLMVKVGYPSRQEERQIMDLMAEGRSPEVKAVIDAEQILSAREAVNQVYVDERIKDYIIELVFATREPAHYGMRDLEDMIQIGASPRASIFLIRAARAFAFLDRRGYVTPDDVKQIGYDILRHRVVPSYEAEAEELSSEDILKRIFEVVDVP
jgi:MoxR-like ATPase